MKHAKTLRGVLALICVCAVAIAVAAVMPTFASHIFGTDKTTTTTTAETTIQSASISQWVDITGTTTTTQARQNVWTVEDARDVIEKYLDYKSLYDSSTKAIIIELGLTTQERLDRIKNVCVGMDVTRNEYYRAIKAHVPMTLQFFSSHMISDEDMDPVEDYIITENRPTQERVLLELTDIVEETRTTAVLKIDSAVIENEAIVYRATVSDSNGGVQQMLFTLWCSSDRYELFSCEVAS